MSTRSRKSELKEPLLSNYDGEQQQQPEHIQIGQFQSSVATSADNDDVNIINLPEDEDGDDEVDGADFHCIHGPNKKKTEDDKPKVKITRFFGYR